MPMGKRKDVNKEFVLLFTVSNENGAWYIERNVKEFAGSSYEYGIVFVLFLVYFFTINIVLCTMYYVLCTMYYVLCTMYYVLCTLYYVICLEVWWCDNVINQTRV